MVSRISVTIVSLLIDSLNSVSIRAFARDSLPPHQPKIRGLGDSVAETVFDDIPVLLRKICNPPFRLINGILNTPGTLKENLLFRNWDEFNGHPRSPPLSRPDAP